MAKQSLSASVEVTGLRETLAAFRKLPKQASAELRDAALKLSEDLATKAQSAARSDGSPQSRLVAPTVKARRDRVPAVAAGGATRVGRNRTPVYKVLFGSEFGSNSYKQFQKPHQGRQGSWFFPTVEREAATIVDAWEQAADNIVRQFCAGGP